MSFIDVLPYMKREQFGNLKDLILTLKEKVKFAQKIQDLDNDDDYKKIQICNNACWALGEIAKLDPESFKKHLVEMMCLLAEILKADLL